MADKPTKSGRSGASAPSGHEPSASAAEEASSQSRVLNAGDMFTPIERARIEQFAAECGWPLRFMGDGVAELNGWLEVWHPKAEAFKGHAGWLAVTVVCIDAGCMYQPNGDPGWPPEYEGHDLGEFADLAEALAALTAEQSRNDAANAEMDAALASGIEAAAADETLLGGSAEGDAP